MAIIVPLGTLCLMGSTNWFPGISWQTVKRLLVDEQFKKERVDSLEVRTFAKRQECEDFPGFLVVEGIITGRVIYFHPSFSST